MDKLIKHRGIHNKNIKENSYKGILEAFKSDKFIGVEFDVRETLDHEIILFHDPIYNNKLISETKYNELPKYVPKLEDILKINTDKIFLIEIKNIKNSYKKFLKIIEKYSYKKIYIMSFSYNQIKNINIDNKNYKVGILNYILNTNKDIKNLDFICILNSFLKKDIINKLENIEIFSYGGYINKNNKSIYYIVD